MQIYHYDDQGIYSSESTAELDPLGQSPLIPGHATIIAPPASVAGSIRVFSAGAWSQFIDNSGKWFLLDGSEVTIKLFEPLPTGASKIKPPPTVAQQNAAVQSQIDALEQKEKMNRFVREAMILLSQQQATLSGLTEPQLYIANFGYKKLKDHNTQINTLRIQMEAIV